MPLWHLKGDMVNALISANQIEKRIYRIRDQNVMIDRDLAYLYEVQTGALKRAVRRNIERFPADFMFTLTQQELAAMRSEAGELKQGRGKHRKYLPFVFTEPGVAMLSSVLNSKRAIQVNVEIMRAFIRLREMILSHKDLVRKIDAMERKYDHQFKIVFDAIRELMAPPTPKMKKLGFKVADKE